jgi:hypothetical protein
MATKNNKTSMNSEIQKTVRRKIIKNGSRGTSFETLLNTAREINNSYRPSKLLNLLETIESTEVRDGFYTLTK